MKQKTSNRQASYLKFEKFENFFCFALFILKMFGFQINC